MAKKRRGPTGAVTATTPAYVPGVPLIDSNGSGSITFNFSDNNNSDKVEYAVYDNVNGYYIKPDGTSNGASEDWNDYSTWDDGEVTKSDDLIDYTSYTFKAKARNEAATETDFSADSLTMTTNPGMLYGDTAENLLRDVESSAVRIQETPTVDGNYANDTNATNGLYGDIILSYVMERNSATQNWIEAEFSKDYDPDTHTDPEDATWAAATLTGGDGTTGLEGSEAGTSYTIDWDSFTDGKGSLLDLTVTLRIRAGDISPASGNLSDWEYTTQFGVNNRPAKLVLLNGDTFSWGEDTTPVIISIFPSLRGGLGKGFPRIHFYKDSAGSQLQVTLDSVLSIENWEYETSPGVWITMTVAGMPGGVADGVNRLRVTVPAAAALPLDTYYINGEMGEVQET